MNDEKKIVLGKSVKYKITLRMTIYVNFVYTQRSYDRVQ